MPPVRAHQVSPSRWRNIIVDFRLLFRQAGFAVAGTDQPDNFLDFRGITAMAMGRVFVREKTMEETVK